MFRGGHFVQLPPPLRTALAGGRGRRQLASWPGLAPGTGSGAAPKTQAKQQSLAYYRFQNSNIIFCNKVNYAKLSERIEPVQQYTEQQGPDPSPVAQIRPGPTPDQVKK